MQQNRSTFVGIGLTCIVAAAMIAWPLFGNPPYGFYAAMKWVVAFASVAGAWACWSISKALLPLSVLLMASGAVELIGKMRRQEWIPFNWASLIMLVFAAIACLAMVLRKENVEDAASSPEPHTNRQ